MRGSIRRPTGRSQPTSASSFYSTPLTISSTQTLKAIAFGYRFHGSPVASAAYTINQSATLALSAVGSSMNPSLVSSPLTFTARVTATAGMPTGSIAFFDGSTQLGSATLSAGSASLTTSALAAGSHVITAVYAGDSNFATLTSAVLTQFVESYTIGTPSGGSSSATVSAGGQANFVLAVTPPGVGVTAYVYRNWIAGGATAMFSPSTLPAGSGATNITLTVSELNIAEVRLVKRPFGDDDLPALLGLFLLLFAGKFRRKQQRWLGLFLLGIVGVIMAAGVSGCSSGGVSSGASTPTPHVYPLTVTAMSGSLTQSTTLTLTVD